MTLETIPPEFQAQIIDLIRKYLPVGAPWRRTIDPNKLLTDPVATEILGVAKGTLNVWRHEGKGPRYVKLEGAVRYRYGDLLDYINHRSVEGGRV